MSKIVLPFHVNILGVSQVVTSALNRSCKSRKYVRCSVLSRATYRHYVEHSAMVHVPLVTTAATETLPLYFADVFKLHTFSNTYLCTRVLQMKISKMVFLFQTINLQVLYHC